MGQGDWWSAALRTLGTIALASLAIVVAGGAAIVVSSPTVSAAPTEAGAKAGATTTTTTTPPVPTWITAWASPTDLALTSANAIATAATARDLVTVPVGGTALKLRLSNLWSTVPTTFVSVTVGVQQGGAAIVPGTIVPVTFAGGSTTVTAAAGADVISDPVPMAVHPGEVLEVSIAVEAPSLVSLHYVGPTTAPYPVDSYATANGAGDLAADPAAAGFVFGDSYTRWLSALFVSGSPAQGTVVGFGDSITDGFNNGGVSWANILQNRIAQLPADQQLSVVKEAVPGNTLTAFPPGTSFEHKSGGLAGVTRFGSDALTLPGVRAIVVLLGTNDIWFGAGGETGGRPIPYGSATQIVQGLQTLIGEAHAAGIKIFGITLLPRASSGPVDLEPPELWTPTEQATLTAVNQWMLTPGTGFDSVINLSAVMADVYNGACQPGLPFPPYFTADNLHPSTAGQTAMANAIPTTLFGIPNAPQVPPSVAAVPTPNCPGAALAEQVMAASATATLAPAPTTTTVPKKVRRPAPIRHPTRSSVSTADVLLGSVVVLVVSVGVLFAVRRRLRRRRAWERLGRRAHRDQAAHAHRRMSVTPTPPGARERSYASRSQGAPSSTQAPPEGTGLGPLPVRSVSSDGSSTPRRARG
ncbi:MAG: GDSL-type esterase/lipase family protein [Acidimicrobiales bacterium]